MNAELTYACAELDRGSDLSGDAPIRFTASSTATNRYGYSLRADGWKLENFRRLPVLLWQHRGDQPPIGRADVQQTAKGLSATLTFDRGDAFAADLERKVRAGWIGAVSVGFDFVNEDGSPMHDWWRMSNEQIREQAFYGLAELSLVSVPADVNALREHRRPDGDLVEQVRRLAVDLAELRAGLTAAPTGTAPKQDDPPTDPPAPALGVDDNAAQALLAAFTVREDTNA